MGLYTVVAPCIVTVNGRAEHHTRSGPVVEVDDKQAAPLVKAGQLEPHEHVHLAVEPEPESPADEPEPPGTEAPRRSGRAR